MLFRNDGKGESNAVQNRFTAYVVLAVQRRKSAVLRHRKEIAEFEHSVDFDGDLVWMQSQQDTDFSALMMQFEIIAFEQALDRLSKRDRYILVTRLLHRRSFDEIWRSVANCRCSSVSASEEAGRPAEGFGDGRRSEGQGCMGLITAVRHARRPPRRWRSVPRYQAGTAGLRAPSPQRPRCRPRSGQHAAPA